MPISRISPENLYNTALNDIPWPNAEQVRGNPNHPNGPWPCVDDPMPQANRDTARDAGMEPG